MSVVEHVTLEYMCDENLDKAGPERNWWLDMAGEATGGEGRQNQCQEQSVGRIIFRFWVACRDVSLMPLYLAQSIKELSIVHVFTIL